MDLDKGTILINKQLQNIAGQPGEFRLVPTKNSKGRTITAAACAALCGAMVCGLADYLWNYPRVMCIFWFVFAVALGGAKLCLEQDRASA